MHLFESLAGEALVYLPQRPVVDLNLGFYVRLLPRDETGGRVDPLTGGFAGWGEDHDTVEQDRRRPVPFHLVEPNKVQARRRSACCCCRHCVLYVQV